MSKTRYQELRDEIDAAESSLGAFQRTVFKLQPQLLQQLRVYLGCPDQAVQELKIQAPDERKVRAGIAFDKSGAQFAFRVGFGPRYIDFTQIIEPKGQSCTLNAGRKQFEVLPDTGGIEKWCEFMVEECKDGLRSWVANTIHEKTKV